MQRGLILLLLAALMLPGCTSKPAIATPAQVSDQEVQQYQDEQKRVLDLEREHRKGTPKT